MNSVEILCSKLTAFSTNQLSNISCWAIKPQLLRKLNGLYTVSIISPCKLNKCQFNNISISAPRGNTVTKRLSVIQTSFPFLLFAYQLVNTVGSAGKQVTNYLLSSLQLVCMWFSYFPQRSTQNPVAGNLSWGPLLVY